MTHQETTDFPVPRLSGGFYGGYILYETAGNSDELVVAGQVSARVLDLETRRDRKKIAQMDPVRSRRDARLLDRTSER
jgi:hypothetical protein